MDSQGQIYSANPIISEGELRSRLRRAVKDSREPMALVILGDKHASHDLTVRLATLARSTTSRADLMRKV